VGAVRRFKYFSRFEFFLISSIVHARLVVEQVVEPVETHLPVPLRGASWTQIFVPLTEVTSIEEILQCQTFLL
jgi:hypothetical protein